MVEVLDIVEKSFKSFKLDLAHNLFYLDFFSGQGPI